MELAETGNQASRCEPAKNDGGVGQFAREDLSGKQPAVEHDEQHADERESATDHNRAVYS